MTESELFESPATKLRITLEDDEPIDAAAAKLYDGVYLWARAMSRVFSTNNGAQLHGCTTR
jgi:phosphotransferase system IIB component